MASSRSTSTSSSWSQTINAADSFNSTVSNVLNLSGGAGNVAMGDSALRTMETSSGGADMLTAFKPFLPWIGILVVGIVALTFLRRGSK